jgi:hypothetical protein
MAMDEARRNVMDGLSSLNTALKQAARDSAQPARGRLVDLSREANRLLNSVMRLGCRDYADALDRLAAARQWLERGVGEENCRRIAGALTHIDPENATPSD